MGMYKFKNFLDLKFWDKYKVRNYLFYSGIFFLPSALSISAILITISFILSNLNFKRNYLKDSWNIPFLLSSILMIISTISHFLFISIAKDSTWSPSLSLFGLFNWIPLFWVFWSAQSFLKNAEDRRKFALILLSGTLPIILTGILQYYFNVTGPFKLFNGFITWYQRPLSDISGMTGLFNNPNYMGSWLNIVWPFSIAGILSRNKNKFSTGIKIFFSISIAFCIILTNSRNAWGGLLTTIPLVVGIKSLIWLLPLFSILLLTIILTTFPSLQGNLQDNLRLLIPDKIWMEFAEEGFSGMDLSRVGIWMYSLSFILSSPILGLGAASFPALLEMETNIWKGHTHNIFLEIAISYGIPSAIILLFTIVLITVISFKIIYFNDKENYKNLYFERAWWASFFILLSSQSVDIQYFDGRISITFWILLAGLKNIISDNIKLKYNVCKK